MIAGRLDAETRGAVLRRARQRRAARATRRSDRTGRSRSTSASGSRGKRTSSAIAARLLAAPPRRPTCSPLVVAALRHARRLSADALGHPRRGAGVRHARRGRLPRRPQRRPAVESGGVHGARAASRASASARSPAIRFRMRRRSSSTRWRGRCRSASPRRSTIEAPFAAHAQGRRDQAGSTLGVPFELTLSCMQPVGRAALRPLQQVPRTPRRVPRGGVDTIRAATRNEPVR